MPEMGAGVGAALLLVAALGGVMLDRTDADGLAVATLPHAAAGSDPAAAPLAVQTQGPSEYPVAWSTREGEASQAQGTTTASSPGRGSAILAEANLTVVEVQVTATSRLPAVTDTNLEVQVTPPPGVRGASGPLRIAAGQASGSAVLVIPVAPVPTIGSVRGDSPGDAAQQLAEQASSSLGDGSWAVQVRGGATPLDDYHWTATLAPTVYEATVGP